MICQGKCSGSSRAPSRNRTEEVRRAIRKFNRFFFGGVFAITINRQGSKSTVTNKKKNVNERANERAQVIKLSVLNVNSSGDGSGGGQE